MSSQHFVYVVASRSRCIYVGMTGDLTRRVGQHKGRVPRTKGFTSLYRANRLIYYEVAADRRSALAREHQLKRWTRARKKALVSSANPAWRDLAARWPTIDPLPRDSVTRSQDGHSDRA